MLGGMDDPSLKHAFIKSFPKKLADETFCLMKLKNKQESNSSLGEIF